MAGHSQKCEKFPSLSPDSTILPGGFTLHTANRLTPMNFMFDHGGPLAWKFQLLPFSAQGGTFHPGTASRVVSGIQGLH